MYTGRYIRGIIVRLRRCAAVGCLFLGVLLMLSSCDEHEPFDSNIYAGFVLCDNNDVMSLGEYQRQLDGPHPASAVGVIFAPETQDHRMMAVMLFENESVEFTNKLGLSCGTSTKLDAFDGVENTISMNNTVEIEKERIEVPIPNDSLNRTTTEEIVHYYFSPLGQWVFRSDRFGQSDHIPSIAELKLLYSQLSVVNETIRQLGGTEINTVTDGKSCWYWSSTEAAEDQPNRAWLFSMATGSYQHTPKDEPHRARAIVYVLR